MNWLEKYKNDFDFKTYYQISQATGITESTLSSIKKANNWKKAQYWNMTKFAEAAGMSLDAFDKYLREQNDEKKP